nr:MAG TPA: hypothetical protein [Bacteriophage sp.]
MNKLNGIVLDGKFYEVVNKDFLGCQGCAFSNTSCKVVCLSFEGDVIFRLNQKITDKINGNGSRQD